MHSTSAIFTIAMASTKVSSIGLPNSDLVLD